VKPGYATTVTSPADSLLQVLATHARKDTVRVQLLNKLGRIYFTQNPAQTARYAREALQLSDSLHYTEGSIWATRNLALAENTKGNLDKQMDMTLAALQLAEKSGQLHIAGILNNDIGNILIEQNNPVQALPYLKRSLQIKQQFREQPEIAKTLNNIGSCYMQLQKHDSALHYLRQSEKVKLLLHDERGLAFTYENMGLIYLQQGRYELSLQYLEKSLRFYQASGNQMGIGKSWLNLAKVNTLLKQYDTAAAQLQQAAGINAVQQNAKNEMIYYQYLAQLDSSRGNYITALQHYNTYTSLKEKYFAVEKAKFIANTREKYESEKKQRENQLLKAAQQIHLTTIHQQRILVAACAFLLAVLLVIALMLYRLYKRQHELYRQLNSKNEEVSQQNTIILEQNVKLGSLNQVKDKIFSVISHDLRSPLAILEGMLFLLRDDKISPEQFRTFTDDLWRDMKNTAYMMDNLLNWASSQMKGIRIKADDFEFTGVVRREIELLQSLARQKEVVLTHHLQQPVMVFADPDMMKLVLRNLISNAIKFTAGGGNIDIYMRISGAHLEICVQDNGIGIPEKDQYKAFSNIYYSTPGTRHEKGCGLGLPLSKDFVELNKGSIWFHSKPGVGTSFYYTIPLSEEDVHHPAYTENVEQTA
jgi:signal transduction histidine kinase/Tfp pilus assembly protein PilF